MTGLSAADYREYAENRAAEARQNLTIHVTSAYTGVCLGCGRSGPCHAQRAARELLAAPTVARLPDPSIDGTLDDLRQAWLTVFGATDRFTSAEVRTWWVDGQCVLVGPHPDTPHDDPPVEVDFGHVTSLIGQLGLPFITADLALRADGGWRVVEIGDGQVSDRPSTIESSTIESSKIVAVLAGQCG